MHASIGFNEMGAAANMKPDSLVRSHVNGDQVSPSRERTGSSQQRIVGILLTSNR